MRSKRAAFVAALPVFLLLLVTIAVRFLPSLAAARDALPTPAGTAPAPSTPADVATQAATEKAASAQLAAFQKGDYQAALAQASRAFRASGITPERFKAIIEGQYAPLTQGEAEFGAASVNPGGAVSLPFRVKRTEGEPSGYEYLLGKEDGAWVILSCRATRDEPVASGRPSVQQPP